MLELVNLASPRGRWLKALSEDWDRAAPLAHALLRSAYDAHEQDARDELLGEWFRRHPQAVTDVALLLALDQVYEARRALSASLKVFFQLEPAWAATRRTPTRRQVLAQFTGGSDLDLRTFIDGLSASDLRAVARDNIGKGRRLPPRVDDDVGGPVSPQAHVEVVGHRKAGGLLIPQVAFVGGEDEAVPSAPTMSSPKIGAAEPHPRAKAQEPTP